MIETLRFVRGAVAKKDYQPALTHFQIRNGRITGFNGTIALSSPIGIDIDAVPKAEPFLRAIENCTVEPTVIHKTEAGRLGLRSGRFRAFVDCLDDDAHELFDNVKPEGETITPLPGNLLPALAVLEPFIGNDASRPWSNGVLLHGSSAYATNNIILLQYWIGVHFPLTVNLPAQAVREALRIGEEPVALSVSDRSLTFHYDGDRWLRMILLSVDWPNVDHLLDTPCEPVPVPDAFYDAVNTLAPFTDDAGRIYIRGDHLTTHVQGQKGATVDLVDLQHSDDCALGMGGGCDCPALEKMPLPLHGAFNHKYLALLSGVATHIDFDAHPRPSGFRGKMLRGVIVGLNED